MPASFKDAFFQLVLHPVKAFANLHQLYFAVALNRANAKDSNLSANNYANWAKQLYANDSLISLQYHQLANGKWNHIMAQTHIGYTYWQQPNVNAMPAVTYVSDGKLTDTAMNPGYKVPSAKSLIPKNSKGNFFYEQNGYVSLEAEHWTRTVNTNNVKWKVIPDIGRTGSGITTFPVTASTSLSATSPHVEYDFYTLNSGTVKLDLYISPTLNFHNNEGLQYAVSIDDEKPQAFSLNKDDNNGRLWNGWVANNVIIKNSTHTLTKAGKHTLKYWMISPAVVLQKLVLDLGGAKLSYLGPPETKR